MKPFTKRMAIVWLVESLINSPRKRPDWTLLLVFAGIAVTLLIFALGFSH
jgi:hypothetical protein